MKDHEDEEELHAPEVDAVEKPPDPCDVPPLRAEYREDDPADHDPDQSHDGDDAEDVYPRAHVGGLAVRQQVVEWQAAHQPMPDRPGPAVLVVIHSSWLSHLERSRLNRGGPGMGRTGPA